MQLEVVESLSLPCNPLHLSQRFTVSLVVSCQGTVAPLPNDGSNIALL